MVLRHCLGMIMSVSTLMIFSGAATPSSLVNFSIGARPGLQGPGRRIIAESRNNKAAIPPGALVRAGFLIAQDVSARASVSVKASVGAKASRLRAQGKT